MVEMFIFTLVVVLRKLDRISFYSCLDAESCNRHVFHHNGDGLVTHSSYDDVQGLIQLDA